jgi:hypothetical protein
MSMKREKPHVIGTQPARIPKLTARATADGDESELRTL